MFTHLSYLNWLWLIPLLGVCFLAAARRRRNALARLAGPNATGALKRETPTGMNVLRDILLLAAIGLLVIALAGPAWNPIEEKVERQGRDVVFVLDVSRSMLAEDLRPSRLERAKADVADCIAALQGDRIALVAFAGNAVVQCPLTQDYGFFRMMLADLTTESVPRGGTNLGDALRVTQKQVFDNADKEFKDIILITDGEDHDSMPLAAAQELGAAGIRLIAIGIGDETAGAPIQVADERGYKSNLKYHGEVVRSKLDSKLLREMAQATPGGVYLPVGTNAFDLRDTYERLIASAARRGLEAETVVHLQPKYQIFLGAAMLLLALAAILPRRRRTMLLPLVFILFAANAVHAQTARQLFLEGNRLLRKDPQAALKQYDAAATILEENSVPAWKELEFNRALANFHLGNYDEAEKKISETLTLNSAGKHRIQALENMCRLLHAKIIHSKGKEAKEKGTEALNSNQPQALQPALEEVQRSIEEVGEAIEIFKSITAPRNIKAKAIRREGKLSRILRKDLLALEKELREKLKQQQQKQDQQQQQSQGQQSQDQQQSQEQQAQDQQQQSQEQQQQSQGQQAQDQQQQQSQEQQSQDSQDQEQKAAQAVKAEDTEQTPDDQEQPLDQELQQIINAEKQRRMLQRARQSRQNPVDKDW